MTKAALNKFRAEFRHWVKSHNKAHGYRTDAGLLLTTLESRIPASYLTQIGSGYLNGWLISETEPGRGYFVREADRPGRWGGQFTEPEYRNAMLNLRFWRRGSLSSSEQPLSSL